MSGSGRWEVEDLALRDRRARSFGAAAAAYDAHRPDYPLAGLRWALEPLGSTDVRVLDLGAGTGKLTGVAVAAGARVTAVEPDEGMRAVLRERHPRVPALTGTAESIPLPDNSMDAIVAGQAFHWFDLPRSFPEFARVLRPGGVLAAFWNDHDDSVEWVAAFDRLRQSSASFPPANPEPDLPTHPLFTSFTKSVFAHSQSRTAESLTATIATHSHALVIPESEREAILGRLTDFLRSRPETSSGTFEMPLRTTVIRATAI
ncbi:class I SAM-dependent methyltransferase [Nocardia sp. JMUB6875]|uniref:class I SAM-dependent methyltransferase n=1 Tax=Nocardia sp. JMUB6875 TaxID=3158170 RepID=UPI0032E78281